MKKVIFGIRAIKVDAIEILRGSVLD